MVKSKPEANVRPHGETVKLGAWSSCKDTSDIEQGPTLMNSLNLQYPLKGPIPKQFHWGLRLQPGFQGDNSVHIILKVNMHFRI